MAALLEEEVNPLQNKVCKEVDGDGGDVLILALKGVLDVASWNTNLIAHLRDGGSNVSINEYCKQRVERKQLDYQVVVARLRKVLSNVEVVLTAHKLLEFVDKLAQFLASFSFYCEVEVI
jgi:hypothetical protein